MEWLQYIFENFSNGEIQSGAIYGRYEKPEEKVIEIRTKSKGSGLPASTIQRFKDGLYTPGQKSINRLRKFYESVKYHDARSSGATIEQAYTIRKQSLTKYIDSVNRIESIARKIARRKKVPVKYILATLPKWFDRKELSIAEAERFIERYKK